MNPDDRPRPMNSRSYYSRLGHIFWSYYTKKTKLNYLPVRLWVEPTSVCNLRCVMCPNKNLSPEEKGFMDFDLFKKIIDEARHFVFDIHLLHRGESLLHPQFFSMVRYAHEAGIITRFHTNGTLLDREKAHQLLESGLDQFAFSFDGFDKKTYEKIRVSANFENTVENIIQFLELKKRLRSRKPVTILELINFPGLYNKTARKRMKEFMRRFHGLPLDKVVIKEMHNWAGEVGSLPQKKKYVACTFLWHALIIFWDGAVLPCTQDFHGYYVLGNVRESSLADIWNGQKMVALREKIIGQDIKELATCSHCDRVWRPKIFGVPREYLLRFLLKRMD